MGRSHRTGTDGHRLPFFCMFYWYQDQKVVAALSLRYLLYFLHFIHNNKLSNYGYANEALWLRSHNWATTPTDGHVWLHIFRDGSYQSLESFKKVSLHRPKKLKCLHPCWAGRFNGRHYL